MQSERGKLFKEHEPVITDDDITVSEATGKGVLSFDVRPVPVADRIGFFAIKLALNDGTDQTILFDELAGRALWAFLQRLGEMDWKLPQTQGGVH